ncbi:MAG: N-acetyl-gamma-glutamyl-phosphate reductase [Candidatus Nitronauta litoralis]|uniref:N-acetyl-gamma-glutamyl-phosphate reductase n=1 Tax=Candidatus Nitronauta litoralis TaxID=2705533 RepID=A0A7T0G001_9BACT|nr:MAG: N-acetyl-gamma-glutamyl-phosphate reductase [Candidatus Nitronauta litoralis]
MIKACIAGATGYTGLELIRLLLQHPDIQIEYLTADSNKGKQLSEVCPSMAGIFDPELLELEPDLVSKCDVVFLALPHTASMDKVPELLKTGCRVIDLSADYRLHEQAVYESWYNTTHQSPQLLEQAVYGLPELHREKIKNAKLVANPGCYPTGAILGLAPLMQCDWATLDSVIADCKSGVSGAGRKLNTGTQFCEANEGVSAYGLTTHRHTPEIEQELSQLAGRSLNVVFSPHLMPMTRGILSTLYISTNRKVSVDEVREHFQKFYEGEPFIRILPPGKYPSTQGVARSNFCDIGFAVDERTNRLIIATAIDNLMKGASSQAVQNCNLMFHIPETRGLEAAPGFP